jgi:hypothetical protein
MEYTQEDLDKALDKFLNSDIAKMPARYLNRVLNTDYNAFQEKRIANTDFKNRKINQKARTAKIDYKANAAKVDWAATRAKGVANTDYEARTAKIDYAAKVANTDYKARNEKIDWEIRNKKLSKPVSQYDKDNNWIRDWDSAKQASIALGLSDTSVTMCLRGRQKTAGGFIWKFKSEQK